MITRSNSKKIRENVRRLPHEVEATLPSWVKCTDPIPREILEEVRSTVLVWMKNVRNYCTKLYEDLGSPQWFQSPDHPILFQAAVPFDDDISATFIHRMILSDVIKPRAGRTEGLRGIRGFLAFPGRIRTRGGPFRVLSGT